MPALAAPILVKTFFWEQTTLPVRRCFAQFEVQQWRQNFWEQRSVVGFIRDPI